MHLPKRPMGTKMAPLLAVSSRQGQTGVDGYTTISWVGDAIRALSDQAQLCLLALHCARAVGN